MSKSHILIDANNIAADLVRMSGNNSHIFDQMTQNGNKIALTQDVLDELANNTGPAAEKFSKWLDDNPDKVERLRTEDLTIEDYRKYQNALDDASGAQPGSGKIAKNIEQYDAALKSGVDPIEAFDTLKEKGDVSMAKALDELPDNYTVLSNDKSFAGTVKNMGYDGPGNYKIYRGTPELLKDMLSDGRISFERFKTYSNRIVELKLTVPNAGKEAAATKEIIDVLSDPDVKGFSADPEMKTQHYYSERHNAVVTIDAEKGLSIETPNETGKSPKHIFGDYRQAAATDFPEFHSAQGGIPDLHKGGMSGVSDATRAINAAMEGGNLSRALGNAAGETGQLLGKATKLLGPIGVVAAGVEGAMLEAKALEYESYGMMSETATLAYTTLVGTHIAQATVDPSFVGGEIPVQAAYDAWAEEFGISDAVKQELEPSSLIEDVTEALKMAKELGYDLAGKGAKALYELGKNNPELLDKLTGSNADKLHDFMEKSPIEQMETLRGFIDKTLPSDNLAIPQDFDILPIIPNEMPNHDGGVNWPSFKELIPSLPNLGIPKMQIPKFKIRADASEYSGQTQHASLSEASVMPVNSGVVSLEDAITMLTADQKTLSAAAEQGQISAVEEAMNHPDAAQMFQSLHSHGVQVLKVEIEPDMSAEDRASELLLAGQRAIVEAGIPMPEEQREAAEQEFNNSYEEDHSFNV